MDKNQIVRELEDLLFPDRIYCISCGHPIDKGMPYSLCGKCRRTFSFASGGHKEAGLHATWYTLPEKETVLRFKYGNRAYYAEPMAGMMADMLRMYLDNPETLFDGIVAVPLHTERYRARGYNQAELLARELAEKIAVPYIPDAVRRIRKTQPLKGLGEDERRAELSGAFGPGSGTVSGMRLLLVDDILTTGATAEACGDVLRAMGAESVRTCAFSATREKATK